MTSQTLTHAQVWEGIDALAQRHDLSVSGLARAAGLDPTTFNKSKRVGPDGRPRWPSTESLAKSLQAAGESLEDFVLQMSHLQAPRAFGKPLPLIGLAQAAREGFFDEAGFPTGKGWDEIPFPELADEHAYALEIGGDSMLPLYRDGDRLVVSPSASLRRGDRVIVRSQTGEVMAQQLVRMTAQRVELKSLIVEYEDRHFLMSEVSFIHRILWASQ
jgi:phage repressor protein C with HTH and peptisase S24 domain